jgi:hypothetical protein
MERISQIAIVLVTASSLALAQTPGWRHLGDQAPAPADQQAQAQDQALPAAPDQQNPEPVAQPGQEGQPAPAPTPAPMPQAAPPMACRRN